MTSTADAAATPHADEGPHGTLRALVTGGVIGSVLSVCNIYAGLKVGWAFNMSITSVLVAFGFWSLLGPLGVRRFGMQENNVSQTGASSAAAISSAGLVAPVPALAVLTGYQWQWWSLSLWVLCCAMLGVFVAALFRRQMLVRDKLPFASGIATATTLGEIYARGGDAMVRVRALIVATAAGAALKTTAILAKLTQVGFPGSISAAGSAPLAAKGITSITPLNLTLALDPSVLLFGSGAIVGIRTGAWMLVGALIGWGFLGTQALQLGWAAPGKPEAPWFRTMVEWMLWPGVAMLVTSALTSLAFSAPQFVRAFRGGGEGPAEDERDVTALPTRFAWAGMLVVGAIATVAGSVLFDMSLGIGLASVLFTVLLAVVALRVTGETNITPVGPMGKVTQLTFGVLDPGNVATNLMAANVTGGSASQAGDMMHDLKTGLLLGTSARAQLVSQCVGVLIGALAGSAVYLVLVPDPATMLLTPEWPAPAMAQWKAVAEVFRDGIDKLPTGALTAFMWGGALGIAFAAAEKLAPARIKPWVPSPTAMGIALCVPAWNAVSFFLGGVASLIVKRVAPAWHARFMIIVAAGLIVGESLTGLVDALIKMIGA